MVDLAQLEIAYGLARDALLAERNAAGYWEGELSTSALSTATAIGALALSKKPLTNVRGSDELIANGLRWLAEHQNPDGGWGDTVRSVSNISTTMLCRAAFRLAVAQDSNPVMIVTGLESCATVLAAADAYIAKHCGSTPQQHAEAIRARYGTDRTFSVPILMMCALAGLVDWQEVPPLPFELACLPQAWFRWVNLPVVSYALPALIAIGQAIHHHRPPRNPLTRVVRALARRRSLRVLQRIQPSSGGFLEATPLTSFVIMALASIGQTEHPVVRKGVVFLHHSVRPDGSWPIDSNLSVWVTTLAINALAAAGELPNIDKMPELRAWLLAQQFTKRHPYTGAAPGGWGWTHLPGSVPDADDTPGALLALAHLSFASSAWERSTKSSASSSDDRRSDCCEAELLEQRSQAELGIEGKAGIKWLLGLQNHDGGWPTFCRGWGYLPFDRSGADLTAHALRALHRCRTTDRAEAACERGLNYLKRTQRRDGSWLPLWFGNQHAPNDENPTYGTARVLAAYRDLNLMSREPAQCAIAWLVSVQNGDGSWGGAPNVPGSVEETALAVDVLLAAGPETEAAVERGLEWLITAIEAGRLKTPEPIGFYFAKLWYFERLYPILFSVAALGRARRILSPESGARSSSDASRPLTPDS